MSDDRPFYDPDHQQAPPRQAQPGELLFEFHVPATHTFYRVELRDHGAYGVEARRLMGQERPAAPALVAPAVVETLPPAADVRTRLTYTRRCGECNQSYVSTKKHSRICPACVTAERSKRMADRWADVRAGRAPPPKMRGAPHGSAAPGRSRHADCGVAMTLGEVVIALLVLVSSAATLGTLHALLARVHQAEVAIEQLAARPSMQVPRHGHALHGPVR
jgi:hypothetical protein